MADTTTYSITLTNDFEGWERYNVYMMGSCRSADGSEGEYIHLISKGATNGNTFTPSPAARRCLQIEAPNCASFILYICVVANTLPLSRIVSQSPPFEVQVAISADGRQLSVKSYSINQWGGATLYIEYPRQ